MNGMHEFKNLADAKTRAAELIRLGWNVFSIFQTPAGWAFHVHGAGSSDQKVRVDR